MALGLGSLKKKSAKTKKPVAKKGNSDAQAVLKKMAAKGDEECPFC